MSSWIKRFLCACTLEVSLCAECQQKEFTDPKQKMFEWGVGGRDSGGSKGGTRDVHPPSGPKFLHFHAVFGKNWPNNRLACPPLGLAPPPLGNPGSATGGGYFIEIDLNRLKQ